MSDNDVIVRCENLTKRYRGSLLRRSYLALDGLSLEVKRGEVVGYIGPNGAGKTTTIKILMGLHRATSGTAEILGQPVGSVASRDRIGYLPERPYFYNYLTAEEFLHFYGSLYGMSAAARRAKIDELLPLVKIEHARKLPLHKFSKGMLQRVGLAQALINNPDLVVLDEPSSGLDPMGRMLIRDVIAELKNRGVTILFSSHILSDVEDICDRVAILVGGKLIKLAAVRDLVHHNVRAVEVTLERFGADDLGALSDRKPILQGAKRATFSVADHEEANGLVTKAIQRGLLVTSVVPRRESLESLFVEKFTAETPEETPEDNP